MERQMKTSTKVLIVTMLIYEFSALGLPVYNRIINPGYYNNLNNYSNSQKLHILPMDGWSNCDTTKIQFVRNLYNGDQKLFVHKKDGIYRMSGQSFKEARIKVIPIQKSNGEIEYHFSFKIDSTSLSGQIDLSFGYLIRLYPRGCTSDQIGLNYTWGSSSTPNGGFFIVKNSYGRQVLRKELTQNFKLLNGMMQTPGRVDEKNKFISITFLVSKDHHHISYFVNKHLICRQQTSLPLENSVEVDGHPVFEDNYLYFSSYQSSPDLNSEIYFKCDQID
jgi:hypothetical protein